MKTTLTPRFVEVSHVIEPGMVTYPGLPVPEVKVLADHDSSRERYQNKSEFLIASLHLCGNTGTYVDAPIHRHRGAADLAALPSSASHTCRSVSSMHARSVGAWDLCEHLTNLAAVAPEGGRLHAVPIAWKGGATFPVRAYILS